MRVRWVGSGFARAQSTRMRIIWLFPLTVFAVAAGFVLRARRRSNEARLLTTEPVSGQWLAEARSREEHPW